MSVLPAAIIEREEANWGRGDPEQGDEDHARVGREGSSAVGRLRHIDRHYFPREQAGSEFGVSTIEPAPRLSSPSLLLGGGQTHDRQGTQETCLGIQGGERYPAATEHITGEPDQTLRHQARAGFL